jgi:hypothetical protein
MLGGFAVAEFWEDSFVFSKGPVTPLASWENGC